MRVMEFSIAADTDKVSAPANARAVSVLPDATTARLFLLVDNAWPNVNHKVKVIIGNERFGSIRHEYAGTAIVGGVPWHVMFDSQEDCDPKHRGVE